MSSITSAFAEADQAAKSYCKAGLWFSELDPDDQKAVIDRLNTMPCLTVYNALADLVEFSDKTWKRHFGPVGSDVCPCYKSGAMSRG